MCSGSRLVIRGLILHLLSELRPNFFVGYSWGIVLPSEVSPPVGGSRTSQGVCPDPSKTFRFLPRGFEALGGGFSGVALLVRCRRHSPGRVGTTPPADLFSTTQTGCQRDRVSPKCNAGFPCSRSFAVRRRRGMPRKKQFKHAKGAVQLLASFRPTPGPRGVLGRKWVLLAQKGNRTDVC